jgi:preprotein translocase subunit SecD
MLFFEPWKKALVIGLCLLGVLFACPTCSTSAPMRRRAPRRDRAGGGRRAIRSAEARRRRRPWPSWLPGGVLNLGLDLRGGAHLLVEVAVEDVYAERMISLWPEARDALRDARDAVGPFRQVEATPNDQLRIRLLQPTRRAGGAADAVRDLARPVQQGCSAPGGATSR